STLYGHLAFRASYTQASTGSTALNGVSRLASSADGQTLFALSPTTGKITSFGIGINGELTRIGSAATDEPGTLATGSALLASADSESVVATSSNPGALHIFKRFENGNVGAVEVLIAGRDAATGLAGATALAQTEAQPNLVYVAAFDDNRVSLFEIGVGALIFRDGFED
ncbi:MAG TPA: hypothetical protein VLA37_13335, partial [Sphingomonadaceae bacterium]|nr:hypothetical protein [Sphingomonadaceae bacterium]